LRKTHPPWTDRHTQLIKQIKIYAKEISCLHLALPSVFKIVEIDVSNIGYCGILKQLIENKEQLVQYTSGTWNNAQRNYITVKKEIIAIVLYIQKFQSDLLNKKFLIRVDCVAANSILTKDVKNLASKQIFARWQGILSSFDFTIEHIKGDSHSLPDYLTREFL
ncbi:hypothetical protein CFOL_v3_09155, partial [Cephalotus follicularis]